MSEITVAAQTLDEVLKFLKNATAAHKAGEIASLPAVSVVVSVSAIVSRDLAGKVV